jgi:hypothetical protein
MGPIKLPGPFPDPNHMRSPAIMFSLRLFCLCCFIRQNQSLMRNKHLLHLLHKIVMGGDGVEITLAEFTVLGLTGAYLLRVYVVAFIVVNRKAVVGCELRGTWLCVLACDTA